MKNKNTVFKIAIATLACFLISYSTALFGGLTKEARFPQAVFGRYLPEFKCSPKEDLKNTTSVVKTYEAKEIHEIDITLIHTDIQMEASDTNATELRYESQNELKLNDQVDGKVLRFTEGENGDGKNTSRSFKMNCGPGLGFNFDFSPTATKISLKIPKSIDSIIIHSVSGDIRIHSLALKKLEVKTVSGDLRIAGDLPEVSANTVSGDITLETSNLSPKLEVHATSGDVHLILKKAVNAECSAHSVSGDFSIHGEKNSSDDKSLHKTFGTGTGKIIVNTVSGDSTIELKAN